MKKLKRFVFALLTMVLVAIGSVGFVAAMIADIVWVGWSTGREFMQWLACHAEDAFRD